MSWKNITIQKDNILEFNQYAKSDRKKKSCIIYADLEVLIKNNNNYKHDPEKPTTTKIREHIPWRY